MINLLADAAIDVVQTGAAAGVTQVTSNAIDMQGFDSLLLIVQLGTVLTTAQNSLQLQDCATSGGTYANVGPAVAYTDAGGASSNGVMVIDIHNIQQRYVKAVLSRTVANTVVSSMIAIRYRGKKLPITQGTTVVAQAIANATS